MGLLDGLLLGDSGSGGLLSYLNSPLYQSPLQPKNDDAAFTQLLRDNATEGALPQLNQPQSIWNQPGITYAPAPAPSVFATGASGIPNFSQQPQQQAGTQAAPVQMAAPPQQPQPAAAEQTASIGNYQMPQIGAPQDYTPQAAPQQASTDVSAQNRQQQPVQELPPALNNPGGLGAGLRGFVNNLHTGPLGAIVGGVGSAMGAQSATQQNLNAQYQAVQQTLRDAGMSPREAQSKAMLAVMNPEAGKTILQEALTNKEKYGVISEDALEGKKYGFINEREQTINGKPLGAGNSAGSDQGSLQAMTDKLSNMRAAGATPEQLLQEVPSQYRGYVSALLKGEALPSNIGRSQVRGSLMTLAHSIDPKFDETLIPQRVKTAQDYAPSGKSGQAITAFNTVQHHIGKLSDDAEKLDNGGWTAINSLRNVIAGNTPLDPARQKSMQAVADDVKTVTDEMSAAYKAGHVSDAEIAGWNKLINTSMPLPQMRQALDDFVSLLNGKRDALNKQHIDIMGRDAPTIDKEENDAITRRVRARNASDSAPSSGLPAGWSVKVR